MFAGQTVLALGSAFMGAQSDMNQYNRKVRAINDEADALEKSLVFQYQLDGLRQQQAQDQAVIKKGESRLRLTEATGEAAAAAASGGVEGLSVDRLIRSFAVATGKDIGNTEAEKDNEVRQVTLEKKGQSMTAWNRLQSLKNEVPEDPTNKMIGRFFSAAFGVGDAYLKNTTKSPSGGGFLGRKF